jgi:hypothetical protein
MAGDPQVPVSPSWTIDVSDVRTSTIYFCTENYTLGHYHIWQAAELLHLRQSAIIVTLGPFGARESQENLVQVENFPNTFGYALLGLGFR